MKSSLCIVLRTADYRDTDKIVTLFSRESGKLAVMASGVKNLKNELSYAVQPLCCGIFYYTEKNGKLFLKQCDIKKNYAVLAENYDAFVAACSMIDYTDRLLSVSDETDELFILLVNSVDALSRGVGPLDVLCFFIVHVLDMLGFFPLFDCCAVCGKELASPRRFSQGYGGAVCSVCAAHIKTVPLPENTRDMAAEMLQLRPVDFSGNSRVTYEITEIFAEYLKFMTEIPIKTIKTL